MSDRATRFRQFTDWVAQHVHGDEKGEAHIFLDRFFQACGHKGCLDVGGTPEYRVKKAKEDGGGTSFADYVWKPHVLIEMKRRGEDLARHFRQAFDYWTRLVPDRPRYVVLCNFDEFWVYDFNTQMDEPMDRLKLAELPDRYGPLTFLFPQPQKPVFENDLVAVTRDAAKRLATCFHKLVNRKDVGRATAQRFIMQMLVALFAEDIDLLEKYFVVRLLDECKSPQDSYDLIGGLFAAMNTPGGVKGGRFQGVQYFNGGLFAEPARIELHDDELNQLRKAADADWSKVRPEIFGTLFEQSVEKEERGAFGQHFTSAVDIMKIVTPTIVTPWRELIENAKTVKDLGTLSGRMAEYRVLDPACGSGNFLYIAYRELKRLEARIFQRMDEVSKAEARQSRHMSYVTVRNFFGIDINPLAVEIAKVTLMIARKLAIDELKTVEKPLPLDNLDANIIEADALISAAGLPVEWPQADVIIGNPPFLGAKLLKPQRGADYVNAVRKAYPEVPGMADYCVYWFRKAHDALADCTPNDPVAGRAGLVGTQNVRNNKSRVGGLDYIVQSGTIVEAVDNQPWSGEANVHVSIANWVKHPPIDGKLLPRERATQIASLLIPEMKKLWYKVEPVAGVKKVRKKGSGPANKEYELAYRECRSINSALSDQANVASAKVLKCNTDPQVCFQGVVTGYNGFVLSKEVAQRLSMPELNGESPVKPYLIGRDLLSGKGKPSRAVIDFADAEILVAKQSGRTFVHVEKHVLPEVRKTAERASQTEMAEARRDHLQRWWQFWNVRKGMRDALRPLNRYLACSRVTKRPIFCFVHHSIVPDGALQVFALEDDYSFGILQSSAHWQWFVANCSKLKSDFRYTPRSVFDTFPWPQNPTVEQIDAVAKAGREVRRIRSHALSMVKGGLREVYRTLELPGRHPLKDAHSILDQAVRSAYAFGLEGDLLAHLLQLNRSIVDRLATTSRACGPGAPADYPNPQALVSSDCVIS